MHVCDLGAGSGYYTVSAGEIVAETGRVYAVEVQKELMGRIKNQAKEAGLKNVEIIWGDIEESGGTKLADNSMDAVFLTNTLFQVEDKEATLHEAKRILKTGGVLLLVDWTDSFDGMGPHKDHVVSMETARKLCKDTGFEFDKNIEAGKHHYGFVVRKP